MANYPPLVLVAGARQQLQAADTVLANGVTARTGTDLALTADGGQLVTIPANVDLQFGAVDSQIGSAGALIEVQNLLDKTATETITGAWQYNNNITFDTTARTIAGIQNGNLLDKTADETVTLGVGDNWNFISSGDNTSPNLTVQATAAQEASTNRVLFQVLASGGGNLFSVDSEGDVNIAGAETVSGASTVVGTANFQGDVNLGNGGDTITLGADNTDTITVNAPTTITIPDSGNFTGLYIDNNDPTTPSDAFQIDGTLANLLNVGHDDLSVNTSAGNVDINSGGAITMDAASASNLTVASAALTLSTTTSGTLTLAAAGLMDINAAANLDLDVTGTLAIDSTDTTNLTMASSAAGDKTLTIAASNGGAGDGLIDIDASGAITIDSSSGGISIDSNGTSNFTATGGTLTLSNTGANALTMSSGGLLDIDAGANLDIDVTGTYDMLASSTFTIAGTGASSMTATSGNLTVSTATSGNLILESAADITFDDDNVAAATITTAIPFANAASDINTFRTNFSNETIIGALNEAFSSAGAGVQKIVVQSLTTAGLSAGDITYLSANDTVLQADADSTLSVARAMGVYDGTANEIVANGRVDITLNDGAAPSAGAPIYLSTVAGRGTATAPSGSGEYVTYIGFVIDNTGYTSAGDTVEVILGIDRPVLV